MGASTSISMIESSVKLAVNVSVQAVQRCGTQYNGGNIIRVISSKNINISNINQESLFTLDSKCIASNDVSTKIQDDISQMMKQLSASIEQQFSILTFSTSVNSTKLITDLSTAVKKSFLTECLTSIESANSITVEDSSGVQITYISQKSFIEQATSCVMSNRDVTEAIKKLSAEVDQQAKSQIDNFFGSYGITIIIIAALCLGAFYLFMRTGGMGGKGATGDAGKWIVIGVVIVLVLLGLMFFL